MSQLYRNTDPHTSVFAAQLALDFVASHEAKIYAALGLVHGITGMTYREIAHYAKLEPVATARRLVAMERRRLITRKRNEVTGRYLARDGMALWFRA